jgi:hypothetical protein
VMSLPTCQNEEGATPPTRIPEKGPVTPVLQSHLPMRPRSERVRLRSVRACQIAEKDDS